MTFLTMTCPSSFFEFVRYQYPLCPPFAMTIKESQGRTLGRVGLYLPDAVFSHGQLFVAMSRIGGGGCIVCLVEGPGLASDPDIMYTPSVVYKAVVQQ